MHQSGDQLLGSSLAEKDLGILVDTKWDRSPQCATVAMRLLCSRLYQPKCIQQVEGNDYTFLFVTCWTTVSSFRPLVQE